MQPHEMPVQVWVLLLVRTQMGWSRSFLSWGPSTDTNWRREQRSWNLWTWRMVWVLSMRDWLKWDLWASVDDKSCMLDRFWLLGDRSAAFRNSKNIGFFHCNDIYRTFWLLCPLRVWILWNRKLLRLCLTYHKVSNRHVCRNVHGTILDDASIYCNLMCLVWRESSFRI